VPPRVLTCHARAARFSKKAAVTPEDAAENGETTAADGKDDDAPER
jgi:hypothetical protein